MRLHNNRIFANALERSLNARSGVTVKTETATGQSAYRAFDKQLLTILEKNTRLFCSLKFDRWRVQRQVYPVAKAISWSEIYSNNKHKAK